MAKLDKEDLLAAWQVLWGQLEPRWHQHFMDDPNVEQIIWYDSEFVYPSLKKFNKLSDILENIKQSTLIEDPSAQTEANEEFLGRLAERDSFLAKRKITSTPKTSKPNPKEMLPLTEEELKVRPETLWFQNPERGWW